MIKASVKPNLPMARWLMIVGVLIIIPLLVIACQPAPTAEPEPLPPPATAVPATPMPTAVPIPDQSVQIAEWESGPHSMDYDLGKGPNSMCSRCHSPQNWIPGSKTSAPPNCVTCKFPTDAELRIAPSFAEGGMDLVTEEQWVGIPCAQCHEVDENGTASAELSWFAPVALTYEEIKSPSELCMKCHTSPSGTKSGSRGLAADHEVLLLGSAHLNYAGEWPQSERPQYCTDCHNAHTGETKQCVDCHTDTADTHTKIKPMMSGDITCMACHDASGAQVGRATEDGLFTTVLVSPPGRGRTEPSTAEILSHSIVYMVSCNRCHFAENPWELTELTAAGQVPTPPAPKP
jgi:hypothetical protein